MKRKHSEASKEKIRNSEYHKNLSGENHPFYGKHHTKEARKKIAESKKGKRPWNKGKHCSEETKKKIRENHADVRGNNNPMHDKHHTKESKRRISDAMSGENHPMYGKHLSIETRKKIGEKSRNRPCSEETKRKISKINKGKHYSPSTELKKGNTLNKGRSLSEKTKEKLREARKHQRIPKHHTKPELIFEHICKTYNLPFKYVGDGKFWIGKPSLNPDFIESNGKKIAIEVFGDYWHNPLLNKNIREIATLSFRKKILEKYGWELIVFWENELKNNNREHIVLDRIGKYE